MSVAARWSAGLGLLGLVISAHLTAAHYLSGQVLLACASGGLVNCEQVTSSPQASLGPVPVAVLGVVWFGGWLGSWAARRASADPRVRMLRLAWSLAGLLAVFSLVYAELFLVGALCLWCTAVHALVIGLFLLAVADAATDPAAMLTRHATS